MTKSENETREQRILDAASDLFVHYGYDKTTVSDIARQAGVSKGAIYLHFQSKDDLLEGLIVREMQAYTEQWLELMEADPQGGTIAALYKNSLYALNSSPFMTAMFRQDGRILGNYLRKPDNFFKTMRDNQEHSDRFLFVTMMQEAGAIRQDIDAKVIAHVMNMLAYGLVGMEGIVPEADIPPIEETIEGIAAIMDSALTPASGSNPQAGKDIVRQIVNATRQQFESMKVSVD